MCENGIINVMKNLGMLEGEVEKTDDKVYVELTYIHTKSGGLHIPLKRPMEKVKEGEILAKVVDVFGETVEEIKAPFDGIIAGYYVYPMVQPGNWSYLFGKIIEE